ncbi:hypothetical protein B0J13DRAFT_449859 [Dactylonectria estremocensis]|uniref:Uncharacterized protein n=1 Tax=Dactylonectria estremocensis TaxID=1079267 RepID=A0A9P9EEU5_9HYPO|nr:hypothetical protein B0J13DRAFT_449859 [Dactylonectria estremocensis]
MKINHAVLVEQLFLDFSLNDVLSKPPRVPAVEPWATMYVDAILDNRFGDAVWARYQICGTVQDGIIEGSNLTVLESIEEDAMGYRAGAPEQYAEAQSFYASTSSTDGHPEVIEIILRDDWKTWLTATSRKVVNAIRETFEEI